MPDKVHLTREGSVFRLRLDDGKANTMEDRFIAELGAALDEVEKVAQSAVVIEGRDGRFSGGLDLKVLPTFAREQLKDFVRRYQRLMLRVFLFPRPVVSAITGHAIAGGCILPMAGDVRVMAEGDFTIGLREVAIGLPLPTFGCELAKAVLPPTSWTRAVLRGELFSPHQAMEMGMVDEVASLAGVREQAVKIATAMAHLPGDAFARTKKMLRAEFVTRIEASEQPDIDALTAAIPAG